MSLKIAKLVKSLAEIPLDLAIEQVEQVVKMQEAGLPWDKVIEVINLIHKIVIPNWNGRYIMIFFI